jgi:ATP-binding protein involved in chromosome partitioning
MSIYSQSAALKALARISDPKSGRDIVSAGLLGELHFDDSAGQLRAIILIDPANPQIYEAARQKVEAALSKFSNVKQANVIMTAHKAAPSLKTQSSQTQPATAAGRRKGNPHKPRRPEGYQGDSQIKHIIAVSSAKGGVGKSTAAVNLAAALSAQGHSAGLLDADIHGPSAPILLGLKGQTAKTETAEGRRLITPLTAHGLKAMSIGFLTPDDGPIVWRGPMVQGAISKMLWDVNWRALDILIIDMPPGTGDAQLGLAQDIKPHGAVIVSTPQDLALADARKGAAMFGKVDIEILGLIENMSLFICNSCGEHHHIFGHGGAQAEAKRLGIPFLGQAPLSLAIRESGDAGVPIALGEGEEAKIFANMARQLWDGLPQD